MALDPLNSSSLEQLAMKGLMCVSAARRAASGVCNGWQGWRRTYHSARTDDRDDGSWLQVWWRACQTNDCSLRRRRFDDDNILYCYLTDSTPSPLLDNIRVMVIVWRLRGNIIRTALWWIVWHSVHSPQHTYVSSSYRSNTLGLSHWDSYAVRRGGCLELYYCNMVEWFWWDSSLIFDDQLVSFSALTLLAWSSGL